MHVPFIYLSPSQKSTQVQKEQEASITHKNAEYMIEVKRLSEMGKHIR